LSFYQNRKTQILEVDIDAEKRKYVQSLEVAEKIYKNYTNHPSSTGQNIVVTPEMIQNTLPEGLYSITATREGERPGEGLYSIFNTGESITETGATNTPIASNAVNITHNLDTRVVQKCLNNIMKTQLRQEAQIVPLDNDEYYYVEEEGQLYDAVSKKNVDFTPEPSEYALPQDALSPQLEDFIAKLGELGELTEDQKDYVIKIVKLAQEQINKEGYNDSFDSIEDIIAQYINEDEDLADESKQGWIDFILNESLSKDLYNCFEIEEIYDGKTDEEVYSSAYEAVTKLYEGFSQKERVDLGLADQYEAIEQQYGGQYETKGSESRLSEAELEKRALALQKILHKKASKELYSITAIRSEDLYAEAEGSEGTSSTEPLYSKPKKGTRLAFQEEANPAKDLGNFLNALIVARNQSKKVPPVVNTRKESPLISPINHNSSDDEQTTM
jgi:hypothetical protein